MRIRQSVTPLPSNGAELTHAAVRREIIATRVADAELERRRREALGAHHARRLFASRELPRWAAVHEVQHSLELVSELLAIIQLLIDRQSVRIAQLEDDALTMERDIERAEHALARVRLRATVSALGVRLGIVAALAVLVFLLLV